MSLTPQEEYVEAGYFADDDYVGGIADVVVGISPYVVEDYIEAGYFIPGGSFASLTATLELAIQFAEATINSTTGMNIDVVRIKQFSSTMSSEFTAGHEENGGIGNNVDPSVVFDTGANVATTATMSTTAGKISQLNANISGAFAATMNVIATMTGETLMQSSTSMSTSAELIVDSSGLLEYFANLNAQAAATRTVAASVNSDFSVTSQPGVSYQGASEIASTTLLQVFEPGVRPHLPTDINGTPQFSTFAKQFGTHSLNIDGDTADSLNEYVEYTLKDTDLSLSNKSTSAFHFELWIRGSTFIDAWSSDRTDGDNPLWRFVAGSTPLFYTKQTQFNNNAERLTGTSVNTGVFNHIAVRIEGSSAAMWVNGSRTDSYTSMSTSSGTSVMYLTIGQNELYLNPINYGNSYIDDLRILRGTASELDTATGYSTSDTSITVPTSANINDVNTKILLHFDGNYIDDDSGVKLYDATINSVSSVNADGTKIVEASSTINSTVGFSSDVGRIISDSANLSSAFGASATGFRIKTTDASLGSAFGSNITENYIRGATATAGVIAGTSCSVGIIFQGDMVADSIASSLTAAGVVGDFFANADATTTLTTSGVVTRGANSTINVSTTTSATPNYTRGGSSTMLAQASLNSSLVTIKDNSMVAVASSALTASVGEITQGNINVNSVAGLSCSGNRLTVEVANFGATFGLVVGGNINAEGNANPASDFGVAALAGVNFEASAIMQGFTAIISINKILHVDQYIYIVPKETRVFSISKETRSHVIDRELRSYSIKGT